MAVKTAEMHIASGSKEADKFCADANNVPVLTPLPPVVRDRPPD